MNVTQRSRQYKLESKNVMEKLKAKEKRQTIAVDVVQNYGETLIRYTKCS